MTGAKLLLDAGADPNFRGQVGACLPILFVFCLHFDGKLTVEETVHCHHCINDGYFCFEPVR